MKAQLGGKSDDSALGRSYVRAADVDFLAGLVADRPRSSADAVPCLQQYHVDAVLAQQSGRRQAADAGTHHHHRRLSSIHRRL